MSVSKLVFTPLNYTGWGSLKQLLPEVRKYNPRHILIVTDPTLEKIGLVERVSVPLHKEGYQVSVYSEILPEPPLETGEKLVDYTRENQFDLVIGLGGGSALDMAKLAAVLSAHEGPVADYLNLSGSRNIEKKGLPKILIPTTSGTGSEVTNISVLSLESTKDVVTHDYLLADAAIVDPELTVSVPAKVTAATGIDALTHAVEAYVSVNASPASDGLALQAIRLIARSIQTAVNNGQDQQARTDMSHGSFIAGLAFFNAGVAGVHALAYPLGGQFHLPHGESNAVLLPYVMGYIRQSCTKRMADILNALGGNSAFLSEEEASRQCVKALEKLVKDVGIPTTLREFNIPEEALDCLTEDGLKQKRLLARSPLPLKKEDIHKIYKSAFEGVITEPS
ncbi:iron-containing alcohol dehydrogenase [Paenactinomyces guangxiensis]|uniref:Iron-containing alcohol dehydrogenase n=1 Tax=Paenactinomyces guangxiensis TaxID=1490290 RepID=A0A7W1WQ98_9BACL|nr:iron-containing alcohol dehydrogenase [Paenactinomyces guangxiensis]MBA4494040.1 iron-containing alcohol dehydrogenase [Paenactinomyces guangxiensis]MBH8591215.1 iron-containing alcohol dehydrogenase [Paenactinomyces guangxiensis]